MTTPLLDVVGGYSAAQQATFREYVGLAGFSGDNLKIYRAKAKMIADGISTTINWLTLGDSIGGDVILPLLTPLFRAHGEGGQHGGGNHIGIVNTLAGGAALSSSANYDKWITGGWYDIPAAGSFTYNRPSYAFNPTKAFTIGKVFYIK